MIIKIIKGKEGISHHEHSSHLGRSQSVEGDPTHLSGGFKRMQSNNNDNKQGNDKVASYRINI